MAMAMDTETHCSSQTNWTIACGSLRDCITFQSSLSFVNDDEPTTNSTPLVLHPPSPDSAPCEITINFAEKHDLRQVYVRSTARVYEIYSASNLRTANDYLCTVRCGVAVRDGEVLRSPDLTDDSIKNEDDWVEVRVPDSPNTPSQTKPYVNSPKTTQDLHEATAEIDDADPCVSVTLRLLSLQNKGCVYVDEIYVFADPVDSADSESQESRNESSSGSSLMAMFLPTLMQLSKTPGLNNLSALRKEKQHVSEDDLEATHPSDSVIKTQLKGKASVTDPQELKLNEVKGGWVGLSQPDTLSQVAKMESDSAAAPSQAAKMDCTCVVPTKVTNMENNHSAVPFQIAKAECNYSAGTLQVATTESNHGDSSGGNVERALQQLVTRMDRLEKICLGFQEKMVMPMNSMEARLQRVEQQLDTLTKKLQISALPAFCRVSASDTSFNESDANSCDNCLDDTLTRESEPDKKIQTEVPHASPHNMSASDSANTTQLLPGLVVTAPEFPDGEDEEGNASGQEMNSSKDKVKPSIDDALSSVLANFLSSLSLESPKYSKSLAVNVPEFSNEDDDPESSINEIAKNDPVHVTDSEKFTHIQELPSSNISLGSGEKVNTDSNDKHSQKTTPEAEEYDQFCGAEEDQDEVCIEASTLAEHNPSMGYCDNVEEDKYGKINGQKNGLSSNISDISNEMLESQTLGGYSVTHEGPSASTELTVPTEVPKYPSHENIIQNVLGFSLTSSVVNFETPLLDVKFISQGSSVADCFLEDLLVETQETSSEDPSVNESTDDLSVKEQLKSNGDVSVEHQPNLISIEDAELLNPASDSHFAADKDLCTLITAPVNIDDDNLPLPEDHKRKREDSDLI